MYDQTKALSGLRVPTSLTYVCVRDITSACQCPRCKEAQERRLEYGPPEQIGRPLAEIGLQGAKTEAAAGDE